MQPATASPRDSLTTDQVVALIQDAAAVTVDIGAELITTGLQVADDISADLVGGSVSRNSYATLHGTATLQVSRALNWGSAIVRPYLSLSDGTTTAIFRLGAYYTTTPERDAEESPVTYDVECHDILTILDDPVGDAYAVTAGTGYLAAVEAILVARGVVGYLIDQSSAASTLPTDRVWAFDDQTTWLKIVNDLLASIGYQGIWSDWDGRLRCQPYDPPKQRAAEWLYDTDAVTSMLGTKRVWEQDYYATPNRWVLYRRNNIDSTPPVIGSGLYSYTNQSTGPTSVDARGRTITKVEALDVADQTALVARAAAVIDSDMQVATKITLTTAPNPLHWHFDRVLLDDPAAGPPVDVLVTEWSLPLDGGDMQHKWTVLE